MIATQKNNLILTILNIATQHKEKIPELVKKLLENLQPTDLVYCIAKAPDLQEKILFISNNRSKNELFLFQKYVQQFLSSTDTIKEKDLLSLYWLFDILYLDKERLDISDKRIVDSIYPVDEVKISNQLEGFYHSDKKKDFEYAFQGFPLKEAWRLCVDFEHQKTEKFNIWNRYEGQHKFNEAGESGYISNTLKGFQETIRTPKDKISQHLIKYLHESCIGSNYPGHHHIRGAQQVLQDAFFGIYLESMTKDGYFELQVNYITGAKTVNNVDKAGLVSPGYLVNYTTQLKQFNKTYKEVCHSCNLTEFEQKIQQMENIHDNIRQKLKQIDIITKQYYKKTKDVTNTPRLLIREIVSMVKSLHRVHPFGGGNGRVFYVLLINRELVNNGFSPMIIDSQFIIDGLSTDETIQHVIISGMQNFQAVKNGKLEGVVSTDDLIRKHRNANTKDRIPKEILKSDGKDLWESFLNPKVATAIENSTATSSNKRNRS